MTTIDTTPISAETDESALVRTPPSALIPNELNPRGDIDPDDEAVQELAASIREKGVLQPLLAFERDVRGDGQLGSEYVLLAGHRRHVASVIAGVADVPVLVVPEPPESDQLEMMLIENGQRSDLTPMQEVRAYQKLLELGVEQKSIAKRLGRSPGHVSKRLSIGQKLPDRILERFNRRELGLEASYALTRVADDLDLVVRIGSQPVLDEKMIIKAVDEELARRKAEKARDDARAELEKQGVPFVPMSQVDNGTVCVLADQELDWNARGWHDAYNVTLIAVEHGDHHAEDCHVATINEHAQLVWGCHEPASHVDVATHRCWNGYVQMSAEEVTAAANRANAPRSAPAREPDPEHKETFLAARERAVERRAFLKALVDDVSDFELPPALTTPVSLFVAAVFAELVFPDERAALQLLGVTLEGDWQERQEALTELATGRPAAVSAAAAVAVLDQMLWDGDGETDANYYNVDRFVGRHHQRDEPSTLIAQYLAWLGEAGFEVGPIETAVFDAVVAAEAAEVED